MNGKLGVELVLRRSGGERIPEWFAKIVDEYKVFETDDRIIMNVPSDWEGFRDGTIIKVLKAFQESIYVAVCYITSDQGETVTDFDGEPVDRFEIVEEGKQCIKYVKKKIRITRVIDDKEDAFEVKGYVLNLKYTEPIIKVLDIYSVGKKSGVTSEEYRG
jgi:hypothetical protein